MDNVKTSYKQQATTHTHAKLFYFLITSDKYFLKNKKNKLSKVQGLKSSTTKNNIVEASDALAGWAVRILFFLHSMLTILQWHVNCQTPSILPLIDR